MAIEHSCEGLTVIPAPIPVNEASPDAKQGSTEAEAADECRLMAELSIIRGGRHYFYDGYSYDRLADAIAYAQIVRDQTRRPALPSATQRGSADSPSPRQE